jgi:hypothetical protein
MYGQRGLADSGRATDRRHHYGRGGRGTAEQRVELGELAGTTGEPDDRGGELPRHCPAVPGLAAGRWRAAALFLDPVPGCRKTALFGRGGAEQSDEYVEPIGGWQHVAGEVLADDPVRPSGLGGELPVREHRGVALPRLPATQLA